MISMVSRDGIALHRFEQVSNHIITDPPCDAVGEVNPVVHTEDIILDLQDQPGDRFSVANLVIVGKEKGSPWKVWIHGWVTTRVVASISRIRGTSKSIGGRGGSPRAVEMAPSTRYHVSYFTLSDQTSRTSGTEYLLNMAPTYYFTTSNSYRGTHPIPSGAIIFAQYIAPFFGVLSI